MGVLTPLFHPLICKCANAGGGADRQNWAKTDQDLLPESLEDKEALQVFKAKVAFDKLNAVLVFFDNNRGPAFGHFERKNIGKLLEWQ